jgi:protein-S-isoprenylcysteine O-methyltransferase Ste14
MSDAAPPTMSTGKWIATVVSLFFWPTLLLALGGDWRWAEGWIFDGWFLVMCASCIVWLYRRDPALLAERFRRPGTGDQPRWDRAIVFGIMLGFLAWIAIMPLDARRFGWTGGFSVWLKAVGGALLCGAVFFLLRAFTDNTFLSPLVRIQAERGHRVVSTGVYGFVRHPMYLGASLMFFGAPLLLGSRWGLAAGAALTLLIAGRIVGEERMLVRDLDGYAEYRTRVRWRLLPFVW